jgi:hypothetical protein
MQATKHETLMVTQGNYFPLKGRGDTMTEPSLGAFDNAKIELLHRITFTTRSEARQAVSRPESASSGIELISGVADVDLRCPFLVAGIIMARW